MNEIKSGGSAFFDPAKANRDAINKQNRSTHEHNENHELSVHSDSEVDNAKSEQVGDKHDAPDFDKVLAKLIDKHIEEYQQSDAADPAKAAARQGLTPISGHASSHAVGSIASIESARSGIKTTNDWGLGN